MGRFILNGIPKVKEVKLNYEVLGEPKEDEWVVYRTDSLSISTTIQITLESSGDMSFLFDDKGVRKRKIKEYLMSKLSEI